MPSVLCLQEALHDVLRSRKDQSNRPWLRHEVLDLSLVLWALALHGSKLRAGSPSTSARTSLQEVSISPKPWPTKTRRPEPCTLKQRKHDDVRHMTSTLPSFALRVAAGDACQVQCGIQTGLRWNVSPRMMGLSGRMEGAEDIRGAENIAFWLVQRPLAVVDVVVVGRLLG